MFIQNPTKQRNTNLMSNLAIGLLLLWLLLELSSIFGFPQPSHSVVLNTAYQFLSGLIGDFFGVAFTILIVDQISRKNQTQMNRGIRRLFIRQVQALVDAFLDYASYALATIVLDKQLQFNLFGNFEYDANKSLYPIDPFTDLADYPMALHYQIYARLQHTIDNYFYENNKVYFSTNFENFISFVSKKSERIIEQYTQVLSPEQLELFFRLSQETSTILRLCEKQDRKILSASDYFFEDFFLLTQFAPIRWEQFSPTYSKILG